MEIVERASGDAKRRVFPSTLGCAANTEFASIQQTTKAQSRGATEPQYFPPTYMRSGAGAACVASYGSYPACCTEAIGSRRYGFDFRYVCIRSW